MMGKILFFSYFERHLRKLAPLIRSLSYRTDINMVNLNLTQSEVDYCIKNQIPFTKLERYNSRVKRRDFDLLWGLEALIRAIDVEQPSIFIAAEVNYILRNAVRYCSQKGVTSIILQHGIPQPHSLHAFVPFEGDYFLTWGEYSKRYLIDNEFPENKIVVTGGMNFDEIINLLVNKKAVSEKIGADPEKNWVIFTMQGSVGGFPTQEELEAGLITVVKEIRNYKNIQLIIKPHPEQRKELIYRTLGDLARFVVITDYTETSEIIKASDALITYFSSTALDALVLHKPILLINLSDDRDFLPLASMGAAEAAYTLEEIPVKLALLEKSMNYFSSTRSYQAASDMNYLNDGKALSRIESFCVDILGKQTSE